MVVLTAIVCRSSESLLEENIFGDSQWLAGAGWWVETVGELGRKRQSTVYGVRYVYDLLWTGLKTGPCRPPDVHGSELVEMRETRPRADWANDAQPYLPGASQSGRCATVGVRGWSSVSRPLWPTSWTTCVFLSREPSRILFRAVGRV